MPGETPANKIAGVTDRTPANKIAGVTDKTPANKIAGVTVTEADSRETASACETSASC
jgi:hypothetical protein